MEFENVHDEVADLRSRVGRLEARLETADQVAHAAMIEIKKHEAETEPAAPPVADVETVAFQFGAANVGSITQDGTHTEYNTLAQQDGKLTTDDGAQE